MIWNHTMMPYHTVDCVRGFSNGLIGHGSGGHGSPLPTSAKRSRIL